MNEKQIAQWKVTRQQGRTCFVLINGVLFWGVLTGLAWSFFMSFAFANRNFWQLLPISLVLFPIGGIAFGWIVWQQSEKKYLAATESDEQTDPKL